MLLPHTLGFSSPLPAQFAKNLPTRFGWSQKEPPKQQSLNLTQDDFNRNYDPTPAFVEKISPFLMRSENLELPGFIMISELERHLPEKKIDHFLEKTLSLLKKHLSQSYSATFNQERIPLTLIKKKQIDGQISAAGNLHNAETQGKWTLKSPHFDRNALVVLHRYAPTENVQDGNLQVIDVKQFLREHPDSDIQSMLNPDKTIREAFRAKLVLYTVTLETNSPDHKVVFLHNTPQNGVAHGVTPLKPIQPDKPIKRIFERYTITRFEPGKTLPPDVSRIQESSDINGSGF